MLPVPVIVAVMLVGYLLVMGCLGLGLRLLPRARPVPRGVWRRGWPGLVRQVAGTAVGGYLVLMAVVVGYYYGVARVSGGFLMSACTGSALLVGLTLPLYLVVSWLVERRRPGGPASPSGSPPGSPPGHGSAAGAGPPRARGPCP
ncbi:DUF6256 family protein [Streptomyces sp. NBC_01803]|uniref:DUF6256 family protein n=1 Tax=Streptomyces sp. NBC_01803 TaxID=2975946 RepID=UPI002DDC0822|nr:DUF6256 family protein [Streptomyces sp. NBC_01803]WSA46481.1 hypothetical protein OIE51_21230 [Streptomyces sp. NBC_01803]